MLKESRMRNLFIGSLLLSMMIATCFAQSSRLEIYSRNNYNPEKDFISLADKTSVSGLKSFEVQVSVDGDGVLASITAQVIKNRTVVEYTADIDEGSGILCSKYLKNETQCAFWGTDEDSTWQDKIFVNIKKINPDLNKGFDYRVSLTDMVLTANDGSKIVVTDKFRVKLSMKKI